MIAIYCQSLASIIPHLAPQLYETATEEGLRTLIPAMYSILNMHRRKEMRLR